MTRSNAPLLSASFLVRSPRKNLTLSADYYHVELTHVPREQNTEADALVNAALDLA